jgi:hypothetical protein
MAPHRHLIVDVTVSSACTKAIAPRIGARLPLHGSLVLEAQYGKLDADLRTSALLSTPFVHSVHDHYPFAMKHGGRLAFMAVELVVPRAIFWWHFVASMAWVLLTLVLCVLTIMSVFNNSLFVERNEK